MKKFLVFLFLIVFVCPFFSGCNKLTVNVELVEKCAALSTKLISSFYNKPECSILEEATDQNFYVQFASDETQNLSAITINNMIYKKDQSFQFSVGNNNFLETPVWKLENEKLFIALPTLYVEAKGGITKVEAGKKVYSIKVYADTGNIALESVDVFGETEGASVSKTIDSAGEILIKHTRKNGKTFIGFLLTKNKQALQSELVCYTKKYYINSKSVSYGVDIVSNSNQTGYSIGLYNYYQNGAITEPKNRTIKYSVAVLTKGNISMEIQISESAS